jgi:hypothetical protein
MVNLSIDSLKLVSGRSLGAANDVKALAVEANQDDSQWDNQRSNDSGYDDLHHVHITGQRWNSAAEGHRARNRLKRNPAVRWSDLVGPLLFICSCPLSAISDNLRTITTDFTDGMDKIIRVLREIREDNMGSVRSSLFCLRFIITLRLSRSYCLPHSHG